MTEQILTQAVLKEHLHYDTETGIFTWVKPTMVKIKVGDIVGCLDVSTGYYVTKLFRKKYQLHRLAWLYIYGFIPKNYIDHINGVTTDNRLINLREATNSQNQQNLKKKTKNNSSGFVGVSFYKNTGKYRANIKINKKGIHLGYYDTPEEAHQVYVDAKRKIHTFNPVLRES